jgi:hypothetical protein
VTTTCKEAGKEGGSRKTDKKVTASRSNGRKAGPPGWYYASDAGNRLFKFADRKSRDAFVEEAPEERDALTVQQVLKRIPEFAVWSTLAI